MIELSHAAASYGDFPVLRDISFPLAQGSNLSIVGPNGSGKTTLLRLLAGLLPYTGSATLSGREIRDFTPRELSREFAFMEQITAPGFSYSVYETVLLGRYGQSHSGLFSHWSQEDHAATRAALKESGLWELQKIPITQLSGGQLQRVFFAQTLVQNPRIILLDEPTNHLDLRYQRELVQQLNQWTKATGGSVIGVLHDISTAMELADDVLLLHEGKIFAFGPTREVLTRENLLQVYEIDVVEHMLSTLERWKTLK